MSPTAAFRLMTLYRRYQEAENSKGQFNTSANSKGKIPGPNPKAFLGYWVPINNYSPLFMPFESDTAH